MSDTPQSHPGNSDAGNGLASDAPSAHDWASNERAADTETGAPTPAAAPVPPHHQAAWHQPHNGWQQPHPGAWPPPPPAGQAPSGGTGSYPYWQQQTPTPPGAWGGAGSQWGGGGGGQWGDGPRWGDPGGPGGWYDWGRRSRPRRSLPAGVIALLVAVAVVVGLGIGHGVWTSSNNSSFSSQGGSSGNPFGNSGNGNGGSNNPFGNSGSGSGGAFGGDGSSGSGSTGGPGTTLSGVAGKVANELVDIDTDLSYQDGEAAGTGIVLTANGYVLTNNHVISGATSIKATDIGNGKTYTADVVGYDRTHDVAVVKLEGASNLQMASFGDSSKVSVGEWVDGLGNAGGLGGTPSSASGKVTALNQSIKAQDESNGTDEQLSGLIETDANIQPGDSGGSLINAAGQVIGMDTAAQTGFSFNTAGNAGYSIPIDQALAITSAIRGGKASNAIHLGQTAFLGVEVDTSQQASRISGAVISSAVNGGAAGQAGIGKGDVITSLGGTKIDSPNTLTDVIGRYHPGDKVAVTWTTPTGQTKSGTLTLGVGPAA